MIHPKSSVLTPHDRSTSLPSMHPRSLRHSQVETLIRRWIKPPAQVEAALGEAMIWLAIAATIRIGLDEVLTLSETFWVPVVAVLATPALIAMALSTWMPALSGVLGYRLILVMMGLLVGGRL